jgi:TolA-binding protein
MELFQFLEDNALFSYEDINTFLVEQSSVTNRQIKDVEYSIVKNSFAANNQILDVVGSLTKQLNKTNRQITELERLVAELQTTVTQMKNLHS